ncbi:MAG: PAS domain-containing protein [Elusimicrobia bacterium]|nr:PAS domain-containing protein [Elusimicrobiota bacterium]
MRDDDWTEEFPAAITVCDEQGVILSMNRAAGEVLRKNGGRALVGKSLLDCHPEPARSLLVDMLKSPRANTYTVEKGAVRKLIHQAPWYRAGRCAGFVELSIVLPEPMAHRVRKEPEQ